MKASEIIGWLARMLILFTFSLLGAGLAGVWVGLARRFYHLGLYWVTSHGQPVCCAWPLT